MRVERNVDGERLKSSFAFSIDATVSLSNRTLSVAAMQPDGHPGKDLAALDAVLARAKIGQFGYDFPMFVIGLRFVEAVE